VIVSDGESVFVGEFEVVHVPVGDGVKDKVALSVGVGEGVWDCEPDTVNVGDGVIVTVWDSDMEWVTVRVGDGVVVGDAVSDGVGVAETCFLGVLKVISGIMTVAVGKRATGGPTVLV
jgi:hypothetical protein